MYICSKQTIVIAGEGVSWHGDGGAAGATGYLVVSSRCDQYESGAARQTCVIDTDLGGLVAAQSSRVDTPGDARTGGVYYWQ